MKIIPVHRTKSLPVDNWEQIREAAEELKALADNGPFVGEHRGCLALHHAQVSDKPFNFFVLSKQGMEAFRAAGLDFGWVIVNPDLSYDGAVKVTALEGCMSWPFRKSRKVLRYNVVRVNFGALVHGTIKYFVIRCGGLPARIFQHEVDHAKGKTIYD